MQDLAFLARWERNAGRSLSVARGIYLRLPGDARLWLQAREYNNPERVTIGWALMVEPQVKWQSM
ncbi:hypothetical protein LuPra_06165 [Luteitalea pratensis]|uniref:Uncharacterized protein n=2 Tax=Luteitalea pratensis TaxID=1855912 RepID=A0A143PWY8_LUTPR|nr:hypothetical protein LuPra_06165 [Luteitalea pratensis]